MSQNQELVRLVYMEQSLTYLLSKAKEWREQVVEEIVKSNGSDARGRNGEPSEPPTCEPIGAALKPEVGPGEPCPACGQKIPMTGAQRQRAYRERRG